MPYIFNPFTGTLDYYASASGGGMSIGGAVTSGTAGSVLFVDASGNLGQNNSKFFWDNTNFRLGIGVASPAGAVDIASGQRYYINGGQAVGTPGTGNFAGGSALGAITSGQNNVGIGTSAGAAITTATSNFCLGPFALANNVGSSRNVAIGQSALLSFNKASGNGFNVAIGSQAATTMTTGTQNVIIGNSTGAGLVAGTNNILIGSAVDTPDGLDDSFSMNLGGVLFGDLAQFFIGNVWPLTSALQISGLPIYANNAGATGGGLTVGAFYRTGANPDPVCVVH